MEKCICLQCKLERSQKKLEASRKPKLRDGTHDGQGYTESHPYFSFISSIFIGVGAGILLQRVLRSWPSGAAGCTALGSWVQSEEDPLVLTLPIDMWSANLFQKGTQPVSLLLDIVDGVATVTLPGVYEISYNTTLAILEETDNLLTGEVDDTALISVGIFKNGGVNPISVISTSVHLKRSGINGVTSSETISDQHLVDLNSGDKITVQARSESKDHAAHTTTVEVSVQLFNFNVQLRLPKFEIPPLTLSL